jgi:hypothetical protein
MEGKEEVHGVYEFIAIYNSLLEAFSVFMIPSRFGPVIWAMCEAPFKCEAELLH